MCATAQGYYTPQNHRPGALQACAELCPPPAWLFEAWQNSGDLAPSPVGPRPWQPPDVQGTEVFDKTYVFSPFQFPLRSQGSKPRALPGAGAVVLDPGCDRAIRTRSLWYL